VEQRWSSLDSRAPRSVRPPSKRSSECSPAAGDMAEQPASACICFSPSPPPAPQEGGSPEGFETRTAILAASLEVGKSGELLSMRPIAFLSAVLFVLAARLPSCVAQVASPPPPTLVVLISGFDSDPSPEQLTGKAARGQGNSGMYQLAGDLKRAGFPTLFFNWNGTVAGHYADKNPPGAKAIVSRLRAMHAKEKIEHLVLVGHSWGGHTMLEVAAALEADGEPTVELAIGVDPSSLGRGERADVLPSSIRRLVCFCTRNAFIWGAWEGGAPVEIVDLGDAAHEFMGDGRPNYAATFDVVAHNAVEWDERVHAAVVERVRRAVSAQGSSISED
jgi:pimeloyl-ACP methyl ester carboxylesterase